MTNVTLQIEVINVSGQIITDAQNIQFNGSFNNFDYVCPCNWCVEVGDINSVKIFGAEHKGIVQKVINLNNGFCKILVTP